MVTYNSLIDMCKKFVLISVFALAILAAPKSSKPAQAYCCVCEFCNMTTLNHQLTEMAIQQNLNMQLQQTLQWFQEFWAANILPALKLMTMEIPESVIHCTDLHCKNDNHKTDIDNYVQNFLYNISEVTKQFL